MKVVIYNILFGMEGNTALRMALSNLSMHGIRPLLPFGLLPQWLRKITVPLRNRHLSDALNLIEKHNPEILCLNEVLVPTHQEELEKRLRRSGFTSIVYGVCRHHSSPFQISLVLATKQKAEEIPFEMTMAPRPGGAGGAASVYIPSENLAVLGVHLALPGPVLDKELLEVNAWVKTQKKLGRRTLVIGDFNAEKHEIDGKIPALVPFREVAFPTCPSFRSIFRKPASVDHIFSDESFVVVDGGAEQGLSDHRLVWTEVK